LEGFDSVIGLQVYMAADKNGGAASTVLWSLTSLMIIGNRARHPFLILF
jgi:hypothetical protein